MAMLASTSRLSLRIVLLSACVPPSTFLLHFWLPTSVEFVADRLSSLCAAVAPWLRLPYLYILVNCIILSIVASSKLQHGGRARKSTLAPRMAVKVEVAPKEVNEEYRSGYVYREVDNSVVLVTGQEKKTLVLVAEDSAEEAAVPDPTDEQKRSNSAEFACLKDTKDEEEERQIVKQSFPGHFGHRRSTKFRPKGSKSLRASKTRLNDTLESTWTTITEGRAIPPTRHLKESYTLGNTPENAPPPPPSETKESETLGGKASSDADLTEEGDNSGKLGRDFSVGQEELNRRVEAFIRKFNEEMRLQMEEESLSRAALLQKPDLDG